MLSRVYYIVKKLTLSNCVIVICHRQVTQSWNIITNHIFSQDNSSFVFILKFIFVSTLPANRFWLNDRSAVAWEFSGGFIARNKHISLHVSDWVGLLSSNDDLLRVYFKTSLLHFIMKKRSSEGFYEVFFFFSY